ncbi:protein lin-52 homolog [Xyrichtys novacula]|uniref:Protein lin-52 homolog n=1 Tax=Xyrichtys novacula TaxID=13765 RepID=A0AAV1GKN4_XYRNO|nr:protein lin-52 homolog [Xyrichtys novacula]
MASPNGGDDFESSLLSFEKLDRASPDLWPEQLPGVAEFAASCKNPITNLPPKWMAELESEDIEMLKELGSLTTANLMEKVKGLQNLAYQLGLEECEYMQYINQKQVCKWTVNSCKIHDTRFPKISSESCVTTRWCSSPFWINSRWCIKKHTA